MSGSLDMWDGCKKNFMHILSKTDKIENTFL